MAAKKAEELERIIAEESLNAEATHSFIDNAFRDGSIPSTGTAITRILPPVSRFSKGNGHATKKQAVLDKLAAFFRSAERRHGKECVSTCRSWWTPEH